MCHSLLHSSANTTIGGWPANTTHEAGMAKASSRDYTKERLNESPQRRKDRAKRNKARRELEREGKVKKGDGKVVNHKKPLSKGGGTSRSNLEVQSKKASHKEGGKLQPKSAKARGGRN